MSHQDDVFFGTFKGVMIFLVVFAVVIYIVVKFLTSGFYADSAMEAQQGKVEKNIAPVGQVKIAGAPAAGAAAPAVAEPAAVDGQQIYQSACFACHGTGAAGAPKLGDKADWSARIAQGSEVLHKHAVEGYQGSAGFMPAKGGRTDLSDAAVMAAVDYMVQQSQ